MRTLDLGCGHAKVKGAIGVDLVPLPEVDLVTNLDRIPYPFADNSFDQIYLNDVIEHLPNTIKAMEELYRICKPGAHVYIRVIHWSSELNATDPTHVRAFTDNTFDFFGKKKDRSYYSKARFDVVSVRRGYTPKVQRWIRSRRVLNFISYYLNNIIDVLSFDLRAEKPTLDPQEIQQIDQKTFLEIVRCPYCLAVRSKRGWPDRVLEKVGPWLVCQEKECQRKFPMPDGLPFMRLEDEQAWHAVPVESLPNVLPEEYHRLPSA